MRKKKWHDNNDYWFHGNPWAVMVRIFRVSFWAVEKRNAYRIEIYHFQTVAVRFFGEKMVQAMKIIVEKRTMVAAEGISKT
jgi:hypothetical protein